MPVNSNTVLREFDRFAAIVQLGRAVSIHNRATACQDFVHWHGQFAPHTVDGAMGYTVYIGIGQIVVEQDTGSRAFRSQDGWAKIVRRVDKVNLIAFGIQNWCAIKIGAGDMLTADYSGDVFQSLGNNGWRFNLNITAQARRVGQITMHLFAILNRRNFIIVIAGRHPVCRIDPVSFGDTNGNTHRDACGRQAVHTQISTGQRINEFAQGFTGINRASGQTRGRIGSRVSTGQVSDRIQGRLNTLGAGGVIGWHGNGLPRDIGVDAIACVTVGNIGGKLCSHRKNYRCGNWIKLKRTAFNFLHCLCSLIN